MPRDDDDIKQGRFASKMHQVDRVTTAMSTSSTTASEDHLREFLTPDFDKFFSNPSDVSLFLKMIAADGLDPLSVRTGITFPFLFPQIEMIWGRWQISLKRVMLTFALM